MALLKLENYVEVFGDMKFKKIRKRGTIAYSEKHVTSFRFDPKCNVISCTVLPSMKKDQYKVKIELSNDGSIWDLQCTCPNGLAYCHHMVAACLHCVHNVTKTDVQCKWVKPKDVIDSEVKKCSDLFPSASFTAVKNAVTEEDIKDLICRMKEVAPSCGFVWLQKPEPDPDSERIVKTFQEIIQSEEFLKSTDPIPLLLSLLKVSNEQIQFVEEATRGQSTNDLWHLFRDGRLSASTIGSILLRYEKKRFPPSFYKKIFRLYQTGTPARSLNYGIQHESDAIRAYESHTGNAVRALGFILHPCGFIGASLDGIVETGGKRICIEVKCPITAKEKGVINLIDTSRNFYLKKTETGAILMNIDFNTTKLDDVATEYYHQMQACMLLAECEEAHFVVWSPIDFVIVPIQKDPDWINNVSVLQDFYQHFYLPKYFES